MTDNADILLDLYAKHDPGMADTRKFVAALDALVTERDTYKDAAVFHARKAGAAEAEVARLTAEMERITAQQPKTLAMIEANGFVFDSIGSEPGNWKHLAFSVYTDLCEVDTIAHAALGKDNE